MAHSGRKVEKTLLDDFFFFIPYTYSQMHVYSLTLPLNLTEQITMTFYVMSEKLVSSVLWLP